MLAVSRYYRNTIFRDVEGQRYLSSWSSISPDDLRSFNDVTVIMQENSRLDKLAQIYLGEQKYWWAICMNNGLKHFWDWIPNQTIYVPTKINRFLIFIKDNI